MQRDKRQKRELLFCVTQPVNDGWLTTTLVLQYDFTADRSEAHGKRLSAKQVEMQAVRSLHLRGGEVREPLPSVSRESTAQGVLQLEELEEDEDEESEVSFDDETEDETQEEEGDT